MALDVFTNHQFKELRQTKKEIQKEKVRLEKDAQPILTKKIMLSVSAIVSCLMNATLNLVNSFQHIKNS